MVNDTSDMGQAAICFEPINEIFCIQDSNHPTRTLDLAAC